MAKHYSDDGDDRADYAQVREHLGAISQDDWDAWRIETGPLSDEMIVANQDLESDAEYRHTHYVAEEDWSEPVEDGELLREFTEDGEVDRGHFGDGNFVPPHWWVI